MVGEGFLHIGYIIVTLQAKSCLHEIRQGSKAVAIRFSIAFKTVSYLQKLSILVFTSSCPNYPLYFPELIASVTMQTSPAFIKVDLKINFMKIKTFTKVFGVVLIALLPAFLLKAQVGFNPSYAVLAINGGANTYYDLNATTINPDFQGANLGSFVSGNSIVIRGAENNVYKCGSCDIWQTKIHYRVYRQGTTPPAFSEMIVGFASGFNNGCGGQDQQWATTAGTTDILSGLTYGCYNLEVYTSLQYQNCGLGDVFNNNSGANFIATFSYTTGPLSGTYSVGAGQCFSTLSSAVTALNANGISGPVTFNVIAGHTETAPAGGFSITATGTATNTITFQKSGPGANPTFTASNTLTAGALNDAIFKIIGGDYITINGFTMQENGSNTTTAAASNNMTEWGVALLYVSATNGSQNNTIQNCTISLNRTYANTFGIYSNTRHTATAVATIADVTSTAGANSGNKIYGNTISNVNMGIAFIGSGTAANQDTGNDVGGSSAATGNTITNWGGAAAVSGYVSNSGTSYCIFMNHQVGDNVSYNTITSATISGTAVTLRGIFKDYTTTGATLVGTTNITNNTVTITDNFTSGTLECIRSQGTVANTSTMNMNSNTILNTSMGGAASTTTIVCLVNSSAWGTLNQNSNIIRGTTSTATTGGFTGVSNTGAVVTTINQNNNQIGNASGGAITFSAATSVAVLGINNTGGAATCAYSATGNDVRGVTHSVAGTSNHTYIINSAATLSQNISNNTFTNLNVNTTGSVIFIGNNVALPTGGSVTANGNSIVTAFNKGSAGGTVTLYNTTTTPSSVAGTTKSHQNNNFSNITVTGGTTVAGWTDLEGASGGGSTKTIAGNTFSNWTCGTSPVTVIQTNYGGNNTTIANNTISNISSTAVSGGSITGISVGSSNGGAAQSITGNTISGLSAGSAGTVVAITGGSTSITTLTISANKIYTLSSSNTSATVTGISMSTGATVNIVNNLIGDLTATLANASVPVTGISIAGGTTANIYYNSVYLAGTSSGALFGSSALSYNSTTTLNLQNNLLVNTCTPTGTGAAVALRRTSGTASTVPANYATTSNNNAFYVTPGASNFLYAENTASPYVNTFTAMPAYKTFMATRDQASVTENVSFQSTTGSNANFLKYNTGTPSQLESGGVPIAGITTDYTGTTRNVSTPDIGAWELTGIAADLTGPSITYTNIPNTLCNTEPSLSATITDASGVNATAGTAPRLYYKKSTDANTFAGNTSANNGWKFVESTTGSSPFSFTLNASLLQAPLAGGDVIQYFVVAQDNAGTPNVSINSGSFAAAPAGVALTAAAFPLGGTINSYSIGTSVATAVTIGATGTYTSITGAGGLFAAINAGGLTGNTVATIIDASVTETGATALNQINYGCSGPVTLTIKPQTTATLTGSVTSGALIKLNGADNVIIDGSNSGGTDKSLTIANTATTAPTAIWVSSTGTGAGATNNTIKNCIINVNSSLSASATGISVSGSTINTGGADNDNVTIQNNTINSPGIGVYANGTAAVSTGGIDNLSVTGNSFASGNSTVAVYGVEVGNALSASVASNTFNLTTTSISAPVAISLETGVSGSAVTSNQIQAVTAANTGGYGGRGITVGTGSASSNITIANNFVAGVNGSNWSAFGNSSSAGIWIGVIGNSSTLTNTTGGVNLYHNTVNITGSIGTASTTALTAALYVGSGASALDIRNNIFVNTQTGTSTTQRNYAIYSAAANAAFTNINYNDYFVSNSFNSGSAILGFIVSDRTTLAALQTGFGGNVNSVNIAPVFTSTTDLHLPGASNATLDNLGTPIGTVTTDIDGQTRSGSTPDMGADEFTPPGCITATGGTASGSTSFCGSGTPTITATGYSTGIGTTYQWVSSTNSGDYPNGGSAVSGQTNPAALTTGVVSTTTYYWLRAQCATNSSTDYSNMITVTINPVPTATASSNSPACTGSTLQLSVSTSIGTSFSWSGPNSFTSTSQNPQISSVTSAAAGTYTVTVTAAGCSATSSTTVVVNNVPVITSTTATPSTVCTGGNSQLQVNLPAPSAYCTSIAFTSGVEAISLVQFAGINNSSTCGISGSALENFTSISGNVVAGSVYPITLSGTTDGNYTNYFTAFFDWNQDGVFETTVPIGTIVNTACVQQVTNNITVPITAVNGTTRMRIVKVFNSSPTNPCGTYGFGQAEDYSINVTGGVDAATYAWIPAAGLTPDATSATVTTPALSATTTYIVTLTNGAGCTATSSVTVTVNSTTAGITNNTGTTTLTCTTTAISLTATGGGTYAWSGGLGTSADATV
ncbi:hypothetical protein C7N43_30555, partial [Sphingobacteriales bacterium UPWRP_1]